MQPQERAPHLDPPHRQGQREPDPEPPSHVGELWIGSALRAHQLGLERHAADRAGARSHLADLRMHRAGVNGAGWQRRGGSRRGREITRRVSRELVAATGGTEVIGMALVAVPVLRRMRVYRHAAYRIDRAVGLRRIPPILTTVIMTALRMAAVIVRVLIHSRSSSCARIP